MTTPTINLARKWRSVQFDQLIGQDISIRILKNSLFSKQFFPVYLFAGNRGCGKTTTARIFAAALNCHALDQFQLQPQKTELPCLTCSSCIAMKQQRHPDFVEMDAASHTGVDNVRSIIEAASLLPVLSQHKIYLIDEAHMLSKAAFNALLKILEEPPRNVFFILATTDVSKILETVRSRCFSLFFHPVDAPKLSAHISEICKKENIQIEVEAIATLVQATGGLVRDAINLLEQVRFAAPVVTKQTVLSVLGHMDDEQVIILVDCLLRKKSIDFFNLLIELKITEYTPLLLWDSILECFRALVWQKHGIVIARFAHHKKSMEAILESSSLSKLQEVISFLYDHQESFKKTISQHHYLEFLLLTIIRKNQSSASEGSACPALVATGFEHDQESEIVDDSDELKKNEASDKEVSDKNDFPIAVLWKKFLENVEKSIDQILFSVFSQIQPQECLFLAQAKEIEHLIYIPTTESPALVLIVTLPIAYKFYYELVESTQMFWQKELNFVFKNSMQLAILFCTKDIEISKKSYGTLKPLVQQDKKNSIIKNAQASTVKVQSQLASSYISIENFPPEIWVKTHMLMARFPGTITSLKVQ